MLETADERRLKGETPASPRKSSGDIWQQWTQLATKAPNIDDLTELLIAWTQTTAGTAEVVNASERFYLDQGKVFHDDSFYHTRTAYFFDHFIFERALSNQSMLGPLPHTTTPYQLFLNRAVSQATNMPEAAKEVMANLAGFRHSLFQIAKISEKAIVLVDLLVGGKFTAQAKPGETFRGLEKRAIFQAFLFPCGALAQLSSGVVIHPQKANRLIKQQIRTARKDPNFSHKMALARLASLQIRYLRHRHVHPKLIYQQPKD